MNLSEAKNSAEAEGTEKSVKFRKTARNSIITLVSIVVLIVSTKEVSDYMLIHQMESDQSDQTSGIPLISDSEESWPRFILKERGKSKLIPVDTDKTIKIIGSAEFRIHCVYQNKSEISYGAGEAPCPKGNMPWVYVTNQARGKNIIHYAYVPL
ncbi:MAG: hypothetical protein NT108_00475 [Candidatus Kaiserbacteria bacterium]|nr:hypothetical protein [Candidatus Kaiserbacteria bacterium]